MSVSVRVSEGAGCGLQESLGLCEGAQDCPPDTFLKTHSEGTREALRDRSDLYFLWNEIPPSAHLPPAAVCWAQ